MDLHFVPPDLQKLDEPMAAEVVACCIWKDETPMRGLAGLVDWRLAGRLSVLEKSGFLLGNAGEVLCVPGRPRMPFDKVLISGYPIQFVLQGVVTYIEPVEQEIVTDTTKVVSEVATDPTVTPVEKESLLQEVEEVVEAVESIL